MRKKYIRKDNIPAMVFKRENPELYKEIMEIYSPVFDRIIAIEMYQNNVPPPVCEICNERLLVTKKMPKNCKYHSKSVLGKNIFTYDLFLENYPGNYDKWVGFKNTSDALIINCEIHGKYEQILSSRITGHGCQKCYFDSKIGKFSIDEQVYLTKFKEIHKDFYDYSLVNFQGAEGKIDIICPTHGTFIQQANVHAVGHGCPACAAQATSDRQQTPEAKIRLRNNALANIAKQAGVRFNTGPELKCKDYLNKRDISYDHQFMITDKDGGNWSFDFYIRDRNLLLETDGEYYHTFREQYNRDRIKDKLAKEQGYIVLRISDMDLNFDLIDLSDVKIEEHNIKLLEERSKHLKSRKPRGKYVNNIK